VHFALNTYTNLQLITNLLITYRGILPVIHFFLYVIPFSLSVIPDFLYVILAFLYALSVYLYVILAKAGIQWNSQ